VKDEAIDANLFVLCNAYFLYKTDLIAQCAQRGHEPAIPIFALPYVACRCAFDKELGLLEYVLLTMSNAQVQRGSNADIPQRA